MRAIDLTGRTFGRLTVIERNGKIGAKTAWKCSCECGNEVTANGDSLRTGRTRSCGCLRRESTAETGRRSHGAASTHGHTKGGRWSPEYTSWAAMNQRCSDPNYRQFAYYGGRGITVCDKWRGAGGFERFLADVGPRPEPKRSYSLDRIDPNGNYEPGNVRWATRAEQTKNRR